jgi:hypothetical protein
MKEQDTNPTQEERKDNKSATRTRRVSQGKRRECKMKNRRSAQPVGCPKGRGERAKVIE